MDPRPTRIVIEELRTLLAEMEAGQQPSNPALSEAVWKALRAEIDGAPMAEARAVMARRRNALAAMRDNAG